MADALVISCVCGRKMAVKSEFKGRRVRCPACGAVTETAACPEPTAKPAVADSAPSTTRKCRYCSETIGLDIQNCPYCDSNLAVAQVSPSTAIVGAWQPEPTAPYASQAAGEASSLARSTTMVLGRLPAVTAVLFLGLLAIRIVMTSRGVAGTGDMTASGGLLASAVANGEPWRLVSYAFLHDGWLHFGLNSLALLSLGTVAEQVIGSGYFLAVFLLAAIGGGGLSMAVGGENVTVGASGSLFGILGMLVVLGIRSRGLLPPHAWARLFGGALPLAVYNFTFSLLAWGGIDHFVHAGGFVVGVLSGLCMIRRACGIQGFCYRPGDAFVLVGVVVVLGGLAVYGRARQELFANRPVLPPVAQPKPAPKPAVDSMARALYDLVQSAGYGKADCYRYARLRVMAVDECEAINRAVDTGRTDPAGRRAMQDYLKSRGINRIHGWVVAKVDTGLYEMAWLRYDYNWGFSVPSGRHFLLKTQNTEFMTTGRFSLWVHELGSRTITTKSGRIEEWQVFIESVVGEAYQNIRRAPAGEPTSIAAQEFLRLVALEAFLERLEHIGMSVAEFKAAL